MPDSQRASMAMRIIQDADGKLTGRIRLQKIAFLMAAMGFLKDVSGELNFEYHHYGPYCEALADDLDSCVAHGFLEEETKETGWGNEYYIYRLPTTQNAQRNDAADDFDRENTEEKQFVQAVKDDSSVLLELAATALYLYEHEGFDKQGNAWAETKSRKQVKARDGRLQKAFELYQKIRAMKCPRPLPEIPFMF